MIKKTFGKICLFLSRHHWWFAAISALTSLFLGCAGFYKHSITTGETAASLSTLYRALQLFIMQSGDVSSPLSWELEVSRFSAPFTAGYTAIRGLLVLFREQVYLMRLGFYTRHVVLCGLGRGGYNLALDLLKRGIRVVVIEKDADNPSINNLRNRGGIVIIGEAIDSLILQTARLNKASRVICFLDRDDDNIELALLIDRMLGVKVSREFIACSIHVSNYRLFKLLCARYSAGAVFSNLAAVPFNINEISARSYFKNNPLDSYLNRDRDIQYHLVVIGFGQTGEAITLQAAKTCHYTGSRRFKITVIDSLAAYKEKVFIDEFPNISHVCDISFVQLSVTDPGFTECSFTRICTDARVITRVIICLNDTEINLETAFSMQRSLQGSDAEIFIRISEEYGLKSLLENSKNVYPGISTFADYKTICSSEAILNHSLDFIAETIHNDYVQTQKEKGMTLDDNSYLCSWDELPEHVRDSNRQQADHIEIKLRAANCVLTANPSDTIQLNPDEIEILSMIEHKRWCAERFLAGWVYGEVRDNTRKVHPDLLPWESISEEVREKDREAVRNIIDLVRLAGKGIARQ